MQGAACVEVFLDDGQEVFVLAFGFEALGDEGVGEGLVRRHAGVDVDGETAFDKFAGRLRHPAPVFKRGKGIVGDEDGLHFFEVGVPVERRVTAKEKVRYHADSPDIAAGKVSFGF